VLGLALGTQRLHKKTGGWLMGHPPFVICATGELKRALVKAHYWGTGDRTFTNAARRNPPPIKVR
jgi:hypothetical protein